MTLTQRTPCVGLDASGRIVLSQQSTTDRAVLSIYDLAPGLYLLSSTSEGKRLANRLVVDR
ncbi:MAG: T9SS type A sorting domain-containing protein [Flavobacteriales bacterium]|nr:T9SS type A sorting domain-containing protein [Flavobacteriales bacterium]MBK6884640.1 T9SS type A sorting domain-containing protein [Flavobacteriales bacterium]MBK7103619.1 T9SS type A sorting domain-containing protein [Flavobacteriales bacterium]MBK7111722.1 T9SS type A sorting domain-containing protein [Flavobacteriales bacterium]MBK7112522.1 T9SS type A sorting domain-containing protein [Flavobacteriales bacterium]